MRFLLSFVRSVSVSVLEVDAGAGVTPWTARKRRAGLARRRLMAMAAAIALSAGAAAARAQEFTSIVVFGDSLSDTGNVAHLTELKYGVRIPGPYADYTDGRFTDGFDTAPAARNYRGVWVEQLAAMIPSKPEVKDSLDGGTDYAYGYAKNGPGMSPLVFEAGNPAFVTINNVGQQITDYLSTHPKINHKTLFVVWSGAIDVLYANSAEDVVLAAAQQAANVQRLIEAGATQFIVPNLPPLGAIPRLNGSPAMSVPATAASVLYNESLRAGLGIVRAFSFERRLEIRELDVFALFTEVLADPGAFGLVDVRDQSRGVLGVDPDTFLFWDDLHPTTRGHNLVALAADQLINHRACPIEGATKLAPGQAKRCR